MCPHPSKDQCADAEHTDRKNPEIGGGIEMFPEPFFIKNGASKAVHDIHQWIQLKQRLHIIRKHINIPHNGRCPHADLECNVDNLLQVSDKYH